ncbi:MAG: pentapeptide repeat-containing protein [Acidobacteria bacterium]|nr:pentapeptide repeat-containing protein [Acidobacteriota bacterium]MYF15680.1 pentapeptide repeat-containing protein [Acidobacteriota bacterium]MYI95301.1 pentapeptide repeat-containing protein [Acidobacteriota bacterium]
MFQKDVNFWRFLLERAGQREDFARLWHGYLAWKLPAKVRDTVSPREGGTDLRVDPPAGGWPRLTAREKVFLNKIAAETGGHPDFRYRDYMDCSNVDFRETVNLQGLTLIGCNFSNATFPKEVHCDDKTRFAGRTCFSSVTFFGDVSFSHTQCCGPVYFDGTRFEGKVRFLSVEFRGGANFEGAVFKHTAHFGKSRFEEAWFPGKILVRELANFKGATFMGHTSFQRVVFGSDPSMFRTKGLPFRRADFSNASFEAQTTFRGASFAGPPAFFEATLHEDTDLADVTWLDRETKPMGIDYAVRAWERLELMMSKLEKPLDRHRFFRFKMRAQSRQSGPFLRSMNWVFDKTAGYGWEVKRACLSWAIHWIAFGALLATNAHVAQGLGLRWETVVSAVAVSFANAHSFLFLTVDGGYLSAYLKLIEGNDAWSLVPVVGTVQAVLGPILLFLMLLTIRNRFRLA